MLKNRNESKFILKNLSLIYNLDSRAVSGPVEAAGESAATVTVTTTPDSDLEEQPVAVGLGSVVSHWKVLYLPQSGRLLASAINTDSISQPGG